MDDLYSTIPLQQLTAWLSEAQTAYHAVAIGQQTVALSLGDKRLGFSPADIEKLRQHIRQLQTVIAVRQGQPNPRSKPSIATWTR